MTSLPQQSTFPPLVVSTNPEATDRLTRPTFTLLAAFTAVIALLGMTFSALGASTGNFGIGITSSLPFALMFCFMFALTIRTATMRGMQSIKRAALTLDAAGLHGIVPQGEVSLPWTAIDRLSVRAKGKHRIITFHLDPSVTPDGAGVNTTLPPKLFDSLRKRGFQIGDVAIDTPIETLAAASGAFTGGRLWAPAT